MAILYRVNAESALFEEALARGGVPFRVRGGGRFLDRPEVKVARRRVAQGRARRAGAHLRRPPRRSRHRCRPPLRGTPRARRRAPPSRRGVPRLRSRPRHRRGVPHRSCRRRCAATTAARPRPPPATRECRLEWGRRGGAAHLPPGQGPRVRHRVRHRTRARPRADLPRQVRRCPRRGATPPLRRAQSRRARAAPQLGETACGRRPAGQPHAEPVVGADRARDHRCPRTGTGSRRESSMASARDRLGRGRVRRSARGAHPRSTPPTRRSTSRSSSGVCASRVPRAPRPT